MQTSGPEAQIGTSIFFLVGAVGYYRMGESHWLMKSFEFAAGWVAIIVTLGLSRTFLWRFDRLMWRKYSCESLLSFPRSRMAPLPCQLHAPPWCCELVLARFKRADPFCRLLLPCADVCLLFTGSAVLVWTKAISLTHFLLLVPFISFRLTGSYVLYSILQARPCLSLLPVLVCRLPVRLLVRRTAELLWSIRLAIIFGRAPITC